MLENSLNSQNSTPNLNSQNSLLKNGLNSQDNLSNDNLNSQNSAPKHNPNPQSKGQIFICPIASSLSRLKGLAEFEGDFLDLDDTLNKEKILNFYAQDFFKACDYCRDMWDETQSIPIAIQSDKVLRLQKDE